MVEQHTLPPSPPSNVWEAIWPTVAPLFTPGTVGAMAATIFITHSVKSVAVVIAPQVESDLARWRAFCTMASIIVGLFVGHAAWSLWGIEWPIILVCAFGSGPVWRLLLALLPERIADTLMTETDRRFRRESKP